MLPDHQTQAATALSCSDLIDMLDELYPERAPDPRDTEREIWMKAGRRKLIRDLIQLRADAPAQRRR